MFFIDRKILCMYFIQGLWPDLKLFAHLLMALDPLPIPQYGQVRPFWKGGKFFLPISAILEDDIAFSGPF